MANGKVQSDRITLAQMGQDRRAGMTDADAFAAIALAAVAVMEPSVARKRTP